MKPKAKTTRPRSPMRLGASRQANIVANLGAEILSGIRKSGSRISYEDLFEEFGVSRVFAREAVKTLIAKGMVASKTRVGTVVLEPSSWNWLDADVLEWRMSLGLDQKFLNQIVEVRRAVEPANAILAARNHTRADLARLRACIQAMRESEGDNNRYSEADLAFHVTLGEISGNPLLRSVNAAIKIALRGFMTMTAAGVRMAEKNHAGATRRHEDIVDAVAARDEEKAARAILHVVAGGQKYASYILKRQR